MDLIISDCVQINDFIQFINYIITSTALLQPQINLVLPRHAQRPITLFHINIFLLKAERFVGKISEIPRRLASGIGDFSSAYL